MCSIHNDTGSLKKLAFTRAINTLSLRTGYHPEEYPFPIALEATGYAIDAFLNKPLPKKKIIPTALKIAQELGLAFDEGAIKQWLYYAIPAQDMAWRGMNKEDILSSSIYISQNTHVRSIGHLVAEITGIKPSSILDIRELYSAYGDDVYNETLHIKTIDEMFEQILEKGLESASSAPFLEEANKQNEAMLSGNMLGWCANALQKAAMIFEQSLSEGDSNAQRAHTVKNAFDRAQGNTPWESLKMLGQEIVKHCRAGHNLTMGEMAELTQNKEELAAVLQSIKCTMQDPQYAAKLDSANELTQTKGLEPVNPAPSLGAPKAAPAMSVSAPAPGGSMGITAARNKLLSRNSKKQSSSEESEK
jgi:hypothetical protein